MDREREPVDDRSPAGKRETGAERAGRTAGLAATVALALWALSGPLAGRASAHAGSLGGSVASATVPTWLVVLTGGIVVGGTFLFTTLLTDHEAMRGVNWWRFALSTPGALRRTVRVAAGAGSVALLALVVWTGVTGTDDPTRDFAILFVWAGWWAGYTVTTYLVGNTWPLVNPWRALVAAGTVGLAATGGRLADAADRSLPDSWGVWPAVAGLLALVWVEVVSPVGEEPRLLAGLVVAYTLATVAGGLVYGAAWFERVDPVSRVFAAYGRVAPLQWTDDGLAVRLPATALTEDPLPDRPGEVAFVVALLWVTTYDGLVATPGWETAVEPLVDAGVPALFVYAVALLAGFGLFVGVYRLAARRIRAAADTYVTAHAIERWFAPALLPIAAGYHVAHFLGYFLGLSPALVAVTAAPLSPPLNTAVAILPGWFGTVKLLCVLGGHVFAIWVAHSLAFELFPGVLAAIRSQYPSVAVMVFYTMTSLWVITQPYGPPPFV